MEVYPAIDLLDGRCVRLYQGDYEQVTVYAEDPVAQAQSFADAGAGWVHVVDLDAARRGEARNHGAVQAIAAALAGRGVRLQVGGGVRDDAVAGALLDAGVARVVVGTAALEDPEWTRRLAQRYPGRVAVGLDARGGDVAVRGWTEQSGVGLIDMARRFEQAGVAALVVTEIGRDGTLQGPGLDQLAEVLAATAVNVVASGGVGVLDDLRALGDLRVGDHRLSGAIVGRAIYEGAFTVAEAIAVAGRRQVEGR